MNYEELMKKHKNVIGKNSGLAEDLKKMREEEDRIDGILRHDLRGYLTNIGGFAHILGEGKDPERTEEYAEIIKWSAKQIENLTILKEMAGISPKEIKATSETFDLEDMARTFASGESLSLKEHYIGLSLKYDRPNGEPIEIYTNPGVMQVLIGTLGGNCINYALDGSKINHGLRITKTGKLEIMMENTSDETEKRRIHGMGTNKGMPFTKKILDALGGEIHTYHTPQMQKNYDCVESFGDVNGKSPKEGDPMFGVRITIPYENLIEKSEE